MSHPIHNTQSDGVLPPNEERVPLFTDLMRLYTQHGLFRSCADLAIIGLLTLLALTDWGSVRRSASALIHNLQSPQQVVAAGTAAVLSATSEAPGSEVLVSIKPPVISEKMIFAETPETAGLLKQVNNKLKEGDTAGAHRLLDNFRDDNPAIAFAKAVVLVRLAGADKVLLARQLLLNSSQKGLGEASLLMGETLLQLVRRDIQGTLTDDYRVILDAVGQPHSASTEELVRQTQLWLEKAAGAGMTPALRFLGLMKARGLGGKVDYVSAASLWKEAANRGDTVSQLEVGRMLTFGHGIQADTREAAKYFRLAIHKRPDAAYQLSAVLLPSALSGDETATHELKKTLTMFLNGAHGQMEMSSGNRILAELLLRVNPVKLREPRRAVTHLARAVFYGDRSAALQLGEFYRWGNHVHKDPVRAYALYLHGNIDGSVENASILQDLSSNMSQEQLSRAKTLLIRVVNPASYKTYLALPAAQRLPIRPVTTPDDLFAATGRLLN